MRLLLKAGVLILILALLGACAPAAPTAAPKAPATAAPAAPTAAPAAATAAPKAAAPTAAPTAPAAKIKRGGTFTTASDADWASLDPHTAISSDPGMNLLYTALVRYKYNEKTQKFDFEPALATEWEVTPTYVIFKLRKDVTFHDGSKFNAEVAKWNINRMLTVKDSLMKVDIPNISSVDVVDEYTIKVNLSAPPAGLLEMLSNGNTQKPMMLSKDNFDKNGEQGLRTRPAGTGPMKFVEWKTADHLTLEKADKYWENGADGKPLPYLDRVTIRVIPDQTAKALALRTDNIQFAVSPDPKDVAGLKSTPTLDVITLPWRSDAGYGFFNMGADKWKSNQKLRQALLYGIDRKAIAGVLGMGTAQAANWHWAKGMIGYDESVPYYDYQPDKAKQLLTEAGFPNGVDVEISARAKGQDGKVAEMLQSMWGKLNIKTTITSMEGVAWNNAMRAGQFDIGISGKQIGELDPRSLGFRFETDGPKNFAHTDNKDLDKCMAEGVSTSDTAKRQETYKRCQTLIFNDAAFWLTWEWPFTIVVNKALKDYGLDYDGQLRLEKAWLDK
ncbi:MAG: ABC transporter substrate-binding protein [Bacteroidetes bacterium]|nr:ABC transporter substrate-binding protein [Bacteroidota bacterium]MCL5026519.1 ABC transporter substrate-binding protein [Chloroflexota bacterium]